MSGDPEVPNSTGSTGVSVPPTVIVVHPRERRSKCSVEPLRDREGFVFCTFPHPVPLDVTEYVRLGIGGPIISEADRDRGLLLLDGTWRLAARMEPFYQHVEVRSLPLVQTAYPRKSEVYADPDEGLATIEALYAALRLLNRDTHGLLDHYHWREQFLAKNPWLQVADVG
jgi:pre-rRNA-processing protein TSR3